MFSQHIVPSFPFKAISEMNSIIIVMINATGTKESIMMMCQYIEWKVVVEWGGNYVIYFNINNANNIQTISSLLICLEVSSVTTTNKIS